MFFSKKSCCVSRDLFHLSVANHFCGISIITTIVRRTHFLPHYHLANVAFHGFYPFLCCLEANPYNIIWPHAKILNFSSQLTNTTLGSIPFSYTVLFHFRCLLPFFLFLSSLHVSRSKATNSGTWLPISVYHQLPPIWDSLDWFIPLCTHLQMSSDSLT